MGLLGGMMKAGIAKKVYDEARKPHNQQKIKNAFSSITNKGNKGNKGSSSPGGAPGGSTGGAPRR